MQLTSANGQANQKIIVLDLKSWDVYAGVFKKDMTIWHIDEIYIVSFIYVILKLKTFLFSILDIHFTHNTPSYGLIKMTYKYISAIV